MFPSGINCYKPANGETVCMTTIPTITVDMSLDLLKRKVTSLERKGQFWVFWMSRPHGTKSAMLDEKLRTAAGTSNQRKVESRFVLEAAIFFYSLAWQIFYPTTGSYTRTFTTVVCWYWDQRSGFELCIVLFSKAGHSHGTCMGPWEGVAFYQEESQCYLSCPWYSKFNVHKKVFWSRRRITHNSLSVTMSLLSSGMSLIITINTTWIQIQNVNEELNSALPRTNPASDGMEGLVARYPAYTIQNNIVQATAYVNTEAFRG